MYFIVISVSNIHAGLVQGHGPPVAILSLGLDHPYKGGGMLTDLNGDVDLALSVEVSIIIGGLEGK